MIGLDHALEQRVVLVDDLSLSETDGLLGLHFSLEIDFVVFR
jgi:hypothetical protein